MRALFEVLDTMPGEAFAMAIALIFIIQRPSCTTK